MLNLDLSSKKNMCNQLIQSMVPLADKVWFRTGGSARFYAEPCSIEEFMVVLQFAQREGISVFILGEGANVLISDAGYGGIVVRLRLCKITRDGEYVTADAGVVMQDLIDYTLENCCSGLEDFSGIPGTIGGSLYINIHYFDHLLGSFLHCARVMHAITHEIITVDRAWFEFGYNTSRLHHHDYYLLDATFKLTPVSSLEAAYAKGRRDEIIKHRRRRYPYARTCGSFFRNFLPHELKTPTHVYTVPAVAFYLDSLGFKGRLSSGGAQVSTHHANMIVTKPGATSTDIIALVRTMQEGVFTSFGLMPQPECLLVGFESYPLLPSIVL